MQESRDDLLRKNLAALEEVDPSLAQRIAWPVGGEHTRRGAGGGIEYRWHRGWLPLGIPAGEVAGGLGAAAGVETILVLGIGLGEQVAELLGAGKTIVAWEHDSWLLRIFLGSSDLSTVLREGRLRLLLGTDLLAPELVGLAAVEHPLLARIYRGEIHSAREVPSRATRSVICAGGLFVEEVRRGLEARGHWTWSLDLARLSQEELELALERLAPQRLFAINYTAGLAEFCDERGVELFVWEIDPSTSPLQPLERSCPGAHVFTYRPAHVEAYRTAGFEHVAHLPLAADPVQRRPLDLDPEEARSCFAPLAHVGSSMVENARACRSRLLRSWMRWRGKDAKPSEFDTLLGRVLDVQRQDPTRFRIPTRLEKVFPGFRAACLAQPGAEDPLILLGEVAASEKRLTWAAQLAPAGLSVWGDAGWRRIEPHGVTYRGPAGHREELTRIYSASPLHWDVGRIYQSDIVTMRVFDVMACGRPVFTEDSPAVHELFEVGVELETYRDPEDLLRMIADYAAHPEKAAAMGKAARRAIEERHSIHHRLDILLAGS